jgi:hypothetical protein
MIYLATHCQTVGYLAALMVLLETDYKRADLAENRLPKRGLAYQVIVS